MDPITTHILAFCAGVIVGNCAIVIAITWRTYRDDL